MMSFYYSYQPLIDFFLIAVGLGYSQQLALRAGVFSIATAGFSALGAYATAILVTRYGAPVPLAILVSAVVGMAVSYVLSVPLARLRGAFQAIATLAFVQVVIALLLYFEGFTGGAIGISGIPRVMNTGWLLLAVLVTIYVIWSINRTSVGRVFNALRQDDSVAASLGVPIKSYYALAFVLSGLIGAVFGALRSLYVFNIEPVDFGFHAMVASLTVVVLGGRNTLLGPIAGALIMAILPELARPLAENRGILNGVILILVITFLPNGVGDELVYWLRRRLRRTPKTMSKREEGTDVVAAD
ncbi:branched-chain amino acid ABC transporter permease [Paracoccus siganidrum]|uniref:Branched-chain amino acid ABC transporter permease n=1 Tax=Paracoccus siganidrum TaxID=1276757 RepID=A0A419AAT0_9RHOB|nr:branched-chain amino acid ABC transporter permease [Paracoccus siganidrum]RJL20236.1 branched-chain amino acid ABC transporter permease [Paracoccus siganidrum]RMC30752.1 branched-chain amino acid ABC transporter permease [Paracoccus siganidrum]